MMDPETIAATGYPSAEHTAFYQSTLLESGLQEHAGGLDFQQGMYSVVHRHRTASEASARFADLMTAQDASVEGHYRVETELFVFFTAAVAAVESACWALHGLGCVIEPGVFPMVVARDRRAISPESTATRFAYWWPKHSSSLSTTLHRVANGQDYTDLLRRRNHLSHRTLPSRTIHLTIIDPGSETVTRIEWDGEPLEPSLTASRLAWLTGAVRELWVAGAEYMDARRADQSWPPAGAGRP